MSNLDDFALWWEKNRSELSGVSRQDAITIWQAALSPSRRATKDFELNVISQCLAALESLGSRSSELRCLEYLKARLFATIKSESSIKQSMALQAYAQAGSSADESVHNSVNVVS